MKRIGIDARLYFQTGVGTYLRNYLYHLQKIDTQNEYYIYVLKKDSSKIRFTNKNFIKKEVSFYWHSLNEQIGFLFRLLKDNVDIMHFTYFSYPILYCRPFIATIHDITPLLFKTGKASTKNNLIYKVKHSIFQFVLQVQVCKAVRIITPTQTVKEQLISLFGEKYRSKILSIYEGVNEELIEATENKNLALTYKTPFFIYVGNFYPHKNLEKLIKALTLINEKIYLILIGPNDYFAMRLKKFIELNHQTNNVEFFHGASNKDLVFFYKNAQALIHPSLSEGFGLPIIEARYYKCPVIASNLPVFTELLQNQYQSFDPYNIQSIADTILKFIHSKKERVLKNISIQYSFKNMSLKTHQIYNSIFK